MEERPRLLSHWPQVVLPGMHGGRKYAIEETFNGISKKQYMESRDRPNGLKPNSWAKQQGRSNQKAMPSCPSGAIVPPEQHNTRADSSLALIDDIQLEMACSCMELALEGERLCKAGDCRMGVQFFEAAVEAGTDDLKTLSAIYSQLGNAYFYLQDYAKALEYHKHDLNLARTTNDKIGEAKASGNLGNTLKVIGRFDEAIVCCIRHLEISREIEDKVGEARALYNLGNVYHAKGKHLGRHGNQDPGEFAPEVKECLQKAVQYYVENLELVKSLSDRSAEGRACGNLGNTHYLLGNFSDAIMFHEKRLSIAKEYGDKAAERRAYTNLGNAHIFLGDFELAADYYKRSLQIAKQLGDRALEAQACYSLGNTYTLMRDFETAVRYHQRHLLIAQELFDRVGEGRACWSLGNANCALGNHKLAMQFANRHLEISKEIGDQTGQMTAQMNLADLKEIMGVSEQTSGIEKSETAFGNRATDKSRRFSMENMELMKLTPDKKQQTKQVTGGARPKQKVQKSASVAVDMGVDQKNSQNGSGDDFDDDGLFDLLTQFQSRRIDDQRCSLRLHEQPSPEADESKDVRLVSSPGSEKLMDMVAGFQASRMNDQRASLPTFPGLTSQDVIGQLLNNSGEDNKKVPDDSFFEMLMRCQATRLEDQRSSLPQELSAPTVPDEDFLSLIMRVQSSRIDTQRSDLPQRNPSTPGKKKKGT
ncbi:G-protein-signaling modulator 2-like isoform X1 [Biomphalaria glabrata]|uniref:G-protein-signaling modulator 2-like isoform X1 n=3 Tax=Biomphalaria glabrata TaxID=6526 RepID=A0A9W3BBV1_BIOGL|nr:G-protein-signaling modulator 2-like isoform X1 [Biomphalaria glabrata]